MPHTNDILTRARAWLEAHAEDMARELTGFVKIRSVSRADLAGPGAPFGPETKRMLDYALLRSAAMGFETKNADGFYGTVSMGDDDNSIGFIAHLDVVPEGVNWIYPPYEGLRQGDFIIGRGSSDNKAAAIIGLFAMRALRELDIPLNHGVRLILGVSEETNMQDMRVYNQREKPCKVTLVADSMFPVNYAQKGSLKAHVKRPLGAEIASFTGGEADNMVPPACEAVLRLTADEAREALGALGFTEPVYEVFDMGGQARIVAHGRAAHAANPESGVSAIKLLSEALRDSGLLTGESLAAMTETAFLCSDNFGAHMGIACEDPDTGATTMVIGIARGEAGTLELHVDSRLSVAEDTGRAKCAFTQHALRHGFEVTHALTTEHVFLPKDDARFIALMEVCEQVMGEKHEAYTMGGGTYARVLKDAITYGPTLPRERPRPENLIEGHGGAHQPDEYYYLPAFIESTLIYIASIIKLDGIL